MYNGEMTDELNKLYDEYYNIFHTFPFSHEELEYDQEDYDDYVEDIKRAIKEKKDLPDIVDYPESDW